MIPQPGWIGLTQIKGEVGALIRFGQWLNGDGFSVYEHAFVATFPDGNPTFPNAPGPMWIAEAQPGGARHVPLHYNLNRIAWIKPPNGVLGHTTALNAIKMVGTPYSFADYGALAAHRLHIPVPGLREYIADSGHEICSAFADRAAKDAGWHLFGDGRWEGYVTPGALRKLAA
jgi:hypothetical protein